MSPQNEDKIAQAAADAAAAFQQLCAKALKLLDLLLEAAEQEKAGKRPGR